MTATGLRHGATSKGIEAGETPEVQADVRFPIRTKITIPYLFLALVLAIGVSLLVTRIVFDTVEERFNNQLIEAGKISSEWMVREEERLLETLRLLSRTQSIPAAILDKDSEGLRTLSFGVVVNNQEEYVEFTNADGELLLSMRHRTGEALEAYDFSKGGSINPTWQAVQQVLDGKTDEYGDKFLGIGRIETGPIFYVTGPVYDEDGQFVGAIIVGKHIDNLI